MIDRQLLTGVIVLMTISLLMSYSLSTYTVLFHNVGNDMNYFMHQVYAVAIGLVMIFVLSRLDPDHWFNIIGFSLFFLFFLLMVVMQFLPENIVKEIGGAKRWINLGAASIAPVEFFKIGFVFFLSWSFARKMIVTEEKSLGEELKMLLPYLFVFGLAVMLIAVFQKDFGQIFILTGTLMIFFVLAGRSMKFFLVMMAAALAAFAALIFMEPHRIKRVLNWWLGVQDNILSLLPFESVQKLHIESGGDHYQISNSLNAIKNGGFFGQGLGNGQFKLGYVSEVHTDFVLSGLTEELGFVGLLFVVGVFLFIVFRLNKIASELENPVYSLFSAGIALLIGLSLIVNSYGISGITPIKGIAVPLLSYGGSQMIANSIAIGMVLMVSKKRVRSRRYPAGKEGSSRVPLYREKEQ